MDKRSYLQGNERETVEHKLKILKQEIRHIIGKSTEWKDLVFVDPHKKEANAHCTHLQIAQADPQTKICKRVQFLLIYKDNLNDKSLFLFFG